MLQSWFWWLYWVMWGFPGGSGVKNPPPMKEMPETWVWSLGWEDPLEEEMATHSSILAWRISWTEEPAGFSEPVGTQLSTQEHIHIGSYSRRSSFVRIVYWSIQEWWGIILTSYSSTVQEKKNHSCTVLAIFLNIWGCFTHTHTYTYTETPVV